MDEDKVTHGVYWTFDTTTLCGVEVTENNSTVYINELTCNDCVDALKTELQRKG